MPGPAFPYLQLAGIPLESRAVSALSFFIGKGGVGKTTLSAAHAVWTATRRPRAKVLLLSTDPAHSLADIFEVRLGSSPRRLRLQRGSLTLWQLDAQKEFKSFLRKQRSAILQVIESGTIFTRAEIEPLLDTTLPGMAEVAGLIAIHRLLEERRYDEIVVDTAPMGHTLRLFEMPQHFASFLRFLDAAAGRDRLLAQHFGGGGVVSQAFIAEWRRMVDAISEELSGADSRLVLVTTPEKFAVQESLRAARALAGMAMPLWIREIVLNRVIREGGQCGLCKNRARRLGPAITLLRRNFPGVAIRAAEDSGVPIVGAPDLRLLAEHVFGGKRLRLRRVTPSPPELRVATTEWPRLCTPLTLSVGKGGVGKTTISAALALHHRSVKKRARVLVCSTDPAPSLDDVFAQPVEDQPVTVAEGVRALEIDSVAQFRAWAEQMQGQVASAVAPTGSGLHVDMAFDREIFMALLDVVPPGVDELFAIFRILDLVQGRKYENIVIDMAPTGHALELLRTPERILLWSRLLLKSLAPHRTLAFAQDVAVQLASLSQRVRALREMLRDRRRSSVVAVMLPEPLPDRETRRLLRDLRGLGTPAEILMINRVLLPGDGGKCRRCQRALAWQRAMLIEQRQQSGRNPLYLIPEFLTEVTGPARLKAFTQRVWRFAGQPSRLKKAGAASTFTG